MSPDPGGCSTRSPRVMRKEAGRAARAHVRQLLGTIPARAGGEDAGA
ncbi:hypothetical protein C7S15_1262 [Burkholderia cepacia]|nr:hypothetical protein [Burkholderia cepacia]